MPSPPNIFAKKLTNEFVVSKCDYFAEVQVWPLRMKLDPHAWLANFQEDEMEYALHLLNFFVYFSPQLVNHLFIAAFRGLSNYILDPRSKSAATLENEWREFCENVLITGVTGEEPNETDSGKTFARKAKQLLSVEEDRILSNDNVLLELTRRPCDLVFVDDFVGSGNQFIETWVRLSSIAQTSFREQAQRGTHRLFYIPLVTTKYGHSRIVAACGSVSILPAHMISSSYSVFYLGDRTFWPPELVAGATDFIRNASKRAGIDTTFNDNWMGFHELGLALAFEDSIPDATIPIFTWDKNGWNPLIRIQ